MKPDKNMSEITRNNIRIGIENEGYFYDHDILNDN